MKAIKYAGIGLVTVLALLLLISFLLPSNVHVERSAMIEAEPEAVFQQVNTLRNWELWSPWHDIDREMKLYYEGPESGSGATYRWESDHPDVGNGSLTITESVPYSRIVTSMDFMEQGTARGTYSFRKEAGGTHLTWAMDADMGNNPIGKYFGLLMDRMVGKDFEKGLTNIKRIAESSPAVEEPTPSGEVQ